MDTGPNDETVVTGDELGPRRPSNRPVPGERFGRYVLLDRIGEGGMGSVYLAHDPDLQREVALKVLRTDNQDETASARLVREAQSLARLEHPNVVSVYEVGSQGPRTFIAMQYVRGQTLKQWQKETVRSVDEVLDVYLRAGRGLAAAHAVEVIHRDFKPANVLVGEDGGVKVVDFGVAMLDGPGAEPSLPSSPTASVDGSVRASLTMGGVVMGTPVYMAPEQAVAKTVDHRADQYAFCVSLYEALYRTRPFTGGSMDELTESKFSGVFAPVGSDASRVPRRVRRALARGLQPEPDRRWPSMDALLDQLRPSRRRRWAWGAGALAVPVVAGTLWATAEPAVTCDPPPDAFAGTWDDATKDRLAARFQQTEGSRHEEVWPIVVAHVDDYVDRWQDAYREACRATRIEHTEDEGLLDLRMHCLRRHRNALQSLTDALLDGDAEVLGESSKAAASLPRISACTAGTLVSTELAPPDDPEVARQVQTLRRRLGVATTRELAGQYEPALALAQQIVEESEATGYAPVTIEARLVVGRILARLQRLDEAEAALSETAHAAGAIGYHQLEALAASQLSFVAGNSRGDDTDGMHWGRHALAVCQGNELPPEVLASVQTNLASVHFAHGRIDEAGPLFESALEIRERVLGPEHFETGVVLTNLASARIHQGRLDEARQLYERALVVWESSLGPHHPTLGVLLNGLGALYERLHQPQRAVPLLDRAIEIRTAALGEEHPETATALETLGSLYLQTGELDRAQELFDRSLAIRQAALPPGHLHLAGSWTNQAMLAEEQGRFEDARRHAERAAEIFEQHVGPDHPFLGYPLTVQGIAALERDAPEEALPLLEKARALRSTGATSPFELATTELALARTLAALRRDEEADDTARAALERLRQTTEGSDPELLAEIEQWLAKRKTGP